MTEISCCTECHRVDGHKLSCSRGRGRHVRYTGLPPFTPEKLAELRDYYDNTSTADEVSVFDSGGRTRPMGPRPDLSRPVGDSLWRCFRLRDGAGPWAGSLTPRRYVLLVVERIRLRRSERR